MLLNKFIRRGLYMSGGTSLGYYSYHNYQVNQQRQQMGVLGTQPRMTFAEKVM